MILKENIQQQEQQVQQMVIPAETTGYLSGNIISGTAEILSGIGGLFNIEPSDYDANEAEYLRQQARKNKKKQKNAKVLGTKNK